MPRAGGGAAARKGTKKSTGGGSPSSPGKSKLKSATSSVEHAFLDGLANGGDLDKLEQMMHDPGSEAFSGMVEKYSREVFFQAEDLPAVALINNGRFDDLTIRDVEELFKLLDVDQSGTLEFEELELMLREVIDPPCTDEQVEAIYAQTDTDHGGTITPLELLSALKGPVKDSLKRMQHDNAIKTEFLLHHGLDIQVDRSLMVDRLKHNVSRDDAFRTLPFSLVYIIVFIFLVISHLAIWDVGQCQRGIEAWIYGYGQQLLGPYLESVSDLDGMFGWLTASGLPAAFGDCQADAAGARFCRVGTRSILVGDAALRQTRRDGSERSVWLLHADQAKEHLKLKPEDYIGAVTAVVDTLRKEAWADRSTKDLRLSFGTFGVRSGLFGLTDVKASFDDFGRCLPKTTVAATSVTPYPRDMANKVVILMFDAVYVMFLLVPMYRELKDLINGCRIAGFSDGFFAYWDLWNCVDWLSIFSGFGMIAIWCFCCQAMMTSSIESAVVDRSDRWVLDPSTMKLSVQGLEELHEDLRHVVQLFSFLRYMTGFTAVAIMMKFFKAFQANPRLQVVTNTMVKAASDIFHFGVVFAAVYMGFVTTGHIFFGNDVKQFRSLTASVDTCFIVLMGDFGWYVEKSEADVGLSSGMPYWILASWFWLYMVFVLMILLNMLLAIILDHYTELTNAIKLDFDVPALWEQTAAYLHHKKKSKGHIPQKNLVVLLDDDDTPCHPGEIVEEASLMEAFPNMQAEQADHLMAWLRQEKRKSDHEGDDEVMARLKMLEKFTNNVNADIHMVKLNTAMCSSMLRGRHDAGGPQTKEQQALGLQSVVDQLGEHVQRLTLKIGSEARELTSKMGEVGRELDRKSFATVQLVEGPSQETAMPAMRGLPVCMEGGCGVDGANVRVESCERVDSRVPPQPSF